MQEYCWASLQHHLGQPKAIIRVPVHTNDMVNGRTIVLK